MGESGERAEAEANNDGRHSHGKEPQRKPSFDYPLRNDAVEEPTL
jgi:hypothetical protein